MVVTMSRYDYFVQLCAEYGASVARGDLTIQEAIAAIERQMETK